MHEHSKIFFKLELIKSNSKHLNFNIHFNPNADNITHDEHTISWAPTKEEQSFLLEALQLIKQQEMDDTIIFNKKYQKFKDTNKEHQTESIPQTENIPNTICEESKPEDQWESIDRIINSKLKIHQKPQD